MGTTRAKINLAPTAPLTVSKDCALYHQRESIEREVRQLRRPRQFKE